MKRLLSVLAPGLLALLPVHADVDLTPHFQSIAGGLINRAYFADGQKQFAVTIDGETTLAADHGGAIFRFTNVAQASMTFQPSPFKNPPTFTPEFLPDYTKVAQKMLPASAEGVELASEAANVLPINKWQSYRFIFTYHIGALGFQESVTFLNLDSGQQIVIRTGSHRKDFPNVAQRADDTLRRWHEVQPGDEIGAN